MGRYTQKHILSPTAARAVDGQSNPVNSSEYKEAILFFKVDAASGTTPKLKFTIQVSPDGTNWFDDVSLPYITAAGNTREKIMNFGNYVRVKWVITGTLPSFTFSVEFMGKS